MQLRLPYSFGMLYGRCLRFLLWDEASCVLDLTGLLGLELIIIRNIFATHFNLLQTVYLPYVNLNDFPMYKITVVFQLKAMMKGMRGPGILGNIG